MWYGILVVIIICLFVLSCVLGDKNNTLTLIVTRLEKDLLESKCETIKVAEELEKVNEEHLATLQECDTKADDLINTKQKLIEAYQEIGRLRG